MTEITFHFNMPDRLDYACRLLRKAWRAGARVAALGPEPLLRELDRALWTFEPREFVPHAHVRQASGPLAAHTAIWLAPSTEGLPPTNVLVNLGAEVPAGFERFERLIELVSRDPQERQAGRQRWKHYAERGYTIKKHEVAP
ncbi:DNA polymerase III subunit chi [Caldimonas tepidiphila]|uniref:DNA polymerase III subunit chi n=1 Tax=Caldimonas tepidiphila TaxID=2315841 RepID=UPI000E5BAC73|nr:DNA polymerase III subunit chi [Caldimonas tepidiphila]